MHSVGTPLRSQHRSTIPSPGGDHLARHEADRDDLFAEIQTFAPRWEMEIREHGETIVTGCRSDGRWSVYRQNGDYWQFLEDGRLRRAFCGGEMLLSTGSGLARLRRERTDTETALLRSALTEEDRDRFLTTCRTFLQSLAAELRRGTFVVRRADPIESNPASTLIPLIERVLAADSPWAPPVAR